jgi:hypothetical protein
MMVRMNLNITIKEQVNQTKSKHLPSLVKSEISSWLFYYYYFSKNAGKMLLGVDLS